MRRRRTVVGGVLVAIVAVVGLVLLRGSGDERIVPAGGQASDTYDPLGFDPDREDELARRAATGYSDVIYEKSPGGVLETARRTARWRSLIERSAAEHEVDADTIEAMVFLESAGRADAIASDLEGAVGLAQILASTATALLEMDVDLDRSRELTERIESAATDAERERLERARRLADERFDPAKAVDGAARYLARAEDAFGRGDLAVATYHMGMGNLETLLTRYASERGEERPSYARLYFDSSPLRTPRTYALLSSLGDDSSNYLWRVRAAREIMRLHREDPEALARNVELEDDAGAGARRLYPRGAPDDAVDPREPERYRSSAALRLAGEASSDFAPSDGAASVLAYIGVGVRVISKESPLTVTGARGVRIEVSRRYRSRAQALAFQFMLDRLQAWNAIAWGRSERTLTIVVGPEATKVLPAADEILRATERAVSPR